MVEFYNKVYKIVSLSLFMVGVSRIRMPNGKQRELVWASANKFGSLKNLAKRIKIPYSTIKNYGEGITLLPEDVFNLLLKLSNTNKNSIEFKTVSSNWGQTIGGKKGIKTLMRKYPNKLIEWRKIANYKSSVRNIKRIKIPELDERLAEFIGVYLGDGTLTKYFVSISGDSRYDKNYFNYLLELMQNLFGIEAKIRKEKNHNVLILVAHSKKLCSFLKEEYGFEFGDKIKNNSLIPKKIFYNNNLSISCLRGLIDTDGCIGKHGNKTCIRFSSSNPHLLKQVHDIGTRLGLFTFYTGNQTGTTREDKVEEYFRIVGSSNLRNIVKFYIRRNRGKFVYQKELLKYYKKREFKNINLPFKIEVPSASG